MQIEFIDTSRTLQAKSTAELEVLNIGYQHCSPGYGYGGPGRTYNLIHFIVEGAGKLVIDDVEFSLSQGDAFIIPAHKMAYYEASSINPWYYTWFGFLGTRAGALTNALLSSLPDRYILHHQDTEKFASFLQPVARLKTANIQNAYAAQAAMYSCFAQLFADNDFQKNNFRSVPLAQEIKFLLDVKYPEKMLLSQVAQHFGIHPNYMTKIFKNAYGQTPKKYLLTLKMQRAHELLLTTNLPISTIARSLGYDNQLAFSKAFHNFFHSSPSSIRESGKNNN